MQIEFVWIVLLGISSGSVASGQSPFTMPPAPSAARPLLQVASAPLAPAPPLDSDPKPLSAPNSPYESPPQSPTQTFPPPPASGPFSTTPQDVPQLPDGTAINGTAPVFNGCGNTACGSVPQGYCPGCGQCHQNYCCNQFSMSPCEAAKESLFGDVYAPGKWRPLDFEDFLSDGWDEPWAGGPDGGEGLTPRHGWLGANDGVFYRLWFNTFSYVNNVPIGNGLNANSYASTYSIFLPLSRRLEILIDTPYVVSGSTSSINGGVPTANSMTQFGDVIVTPRFLLQESQRVTQVFAVGVETPTGANNLPSQGHTSITPRYEFWTNPVGAWVARGGLGVFVPLDNRTASTSMTGNFALGRYLTGDRPFLGNLVLYGSTNIVSSFETRSPSTVSVGPGTRFHLGNNWFALAYASFFLTTPQPGNYLTQVALMKVF